MNRKALSTLALWAGFWLLALALVAALASVPVFQLRHARTVDLGGLIASGLALVVAWALRPRLGEKKQKAFSLPRGGHPALFAFIDEVARAAGSRPPDEVRLTGTVNAYASIETRWLGLRRTRVVGIGLPLFGLLDRDELAAILTHEFGHHLAGDTALGPWVYRTRRSVALAEEALEDSAFFLDVPFRAYGKWLMRVSGSVSRDQERAADALAADRVGAAAAARALEKTHRFGTLWAAYFGFEVIRAVESGAKVPLLDGFRRFAALERRRPEIEKFIHETDAEPPTPEDTHPPLEERLRALGAGRAKLPAVSELRGCASAFGGEALLEDTWYALAVEAKLEPRSWDAVPREVTIPELAKSFQGSFLDPDVVPLTDLPKLVADREAIWTRVRTGGGGFDYLSPAAKRLRGQRVLVDWFAVALVRAGYAAEQEPGGPLLLRQGDEVVDPAEQVEALAAGTVQARDFIAWAEHVLAATGRAVDDRVGVAPLAVDAE